MALVEGTEDLRWFVLPQEVSESNGHFSALEHSPLRTFRFADTSTATSAVVASTAAKSEPQKSLSNVADELDDFFGVMEGEETDAVESDAAVSVTAASAASQDPSVEGVCELRPSWRDPIDLEAAAKEKQRGVKWHVPPKKTIWKKTREAIFEFDMIRPGDKVLVCVSGGKVEILFCFVQFPFFFFFFFFFKKKRIR